MNRELAWYILNEKGYNYALSDVEEACEFLDHPELTENSPHFHKWAEPYTRRCYCCAIGYTNSGRFYAVEPSDGWITLMKQIQPEWRSKYKEPYKGHKHA